MYNEMQKVKNNFIESLEILNQFISDENNFITIESAGKLMVESIESGGKIISCGNGGSMADAMHFAEELTGRFRDNRKAIAAISISDPTHISCTANDFGYDFVFSRYIEAIGSKADILLAISTSGNSKNVILAAEAAHKKGMKVIALTGKDGGKLAPLCDIEIRAPFSKYADRVQEIHIKIIHSLIDYIENNI
ncbi:MAG: phosphoheptose isomerase [Bacteroidetes bacterium GWC2_33_15]|nr:MAG: phosphoheptose isomerase [Bacteroidetes bacterium GWA2_33_15]OFX52549.1 MAG: phosphoheptose isomerase [Bacteroidetes bacterium GWC2_33_15]OFX63894.1 MAG: phosphoheptose isomerase [Bacteroidetes bacterium GWB2_32_14]OFX70839.1 MAG: phosphoheptose isomerase [Bacteroidetes bacterium GWD2_33_33]